VRNVLWYPDHRFLEGNKEIEDLDLSFNVIQAAGAESLAEVRSVCAARDVVYSLPVGSLQAITKNNTLTVLNLRNNGLGSIGESASSMM
jgi:Ran GTPase-activating protein (RanGAP) involved in mRNA processing and transport